MWWCRSADLACRASEPRRDPESDRIRGLLVELGDFCAKVECPGIDPRVRGRAQILFYELATRDPRSLHKLGDPLNDPTK